MCTICFKYTVALRLSSDRTTLVGQVRELARLLLLKRIYNGVHIRCTAVAANLANGTDRHSRFGTDTSVTLYTPLRIFCTTAVRRKNDSLVFAPLGRGYHHLRGRTDARLARHLTN